ncbi:6734_t:CDS:1, partial [Ambispora leptoticha]
IQASPQPICYDAASASYGYCRPICSCPTSAGVSTACMCAMPVATSTI